MCWHYQTSNIITGWYISKSDTIFFTVTCLKNWIWKFWVWSPVTSMCWFLFINETFASIENKTLRIQQLTDSEIQGIWNAAVSWGEYLPMFQGITVPSSLFPRWQWSYHNLKTSNTKCSTTQDHIPYDLNLWQLCYEKPKSCNISNISLSPTNVQWTLSCKSPVPPPFSSYNWSNTVFPSGAAIS